jgi:integrase
MYLYQELAKETYVKKGVECLLSAKTVLEHHRLLHSMLQQAMYWQMIPYNPASRVRPPKARKPAISFYDDIQTITLIKALEGEELKFRVIILLTIFTGLRRGEVLGLEWQDIDFKNPSISVRQASQYVASIGIYTKDPKNETSIRKISIPDSIIKLLKEYQRKQLEQRLRCGDKWISTSRLFTQWNGKPMHPDTVTDWFRKFIIKKKLPYITFHGLRHTHATLLIAQGLDVRTVSNRLGHAQTSTTLNIYAHSFARMDKEASEKLDNLLYREDTKNNFRAN